MAPSALLFRLLVRRVLVPRLLNRRVLGSLALGAAAVVTTRAVLRRRRYRSITGKNALVTGGSRGLGLEIARLLVDRGANIAIVARDGDEIERAVQLLRARSNDAVRVVGYACDLTEPASLETMLTAVRDALGPIDVLVNDAGGIEVGPLDAMTLDDFARAMDLHYFAPLRTMLALRDSMRARGGGCIANVASIGGEVAVPHLLPYSGSKFALVGLSQGMRAELARDDIRVSTVVPGLMRTGSPRNALFKGQHRKEYAWFAIADSLPGLSVSSARAAKKIVRALEYGDPYVSIGFAATLARLAAGIAPGLVVRALTLTNAVLPEGSDPRPRRGAESESPLVPSPLTVLTQRAELDNNQK